jgi:squalene synthase HpnC
MSSRQAAGAAPSVRLDAAYRHCEALVRAHYENFPVASWFLPKERRRHLAALYAYARTADDFADEAEHEGRRLQQLDQWEQQLDQCLEGSAENPVFVALADTVRACRLAPEPLRHLLEAYRMDVERSRHDDWDALMHYCSRSADPVGRLVLGVFGHDSPALPPLSDAVCTGLQLANFWQDIAVDLEKDRIYLPADARRRHGVSEDSLRAGEVSPEFRALLAEMIARTREIFQLGRQLPSHVSGTLGFHLRLVWWGGSRILDGIEACGYDVFRRRPTLKKRHRLAIAGRALAGYVFPHAGRLETGPSA